MEVVEAQQEVKYKNPPARSKICPCDAKCTRKYIQPKRPNSFAPERKYYRPTNPLEAHTTYLDTYLNVDHKAARQTRVLPIRPKATLDTLTGKFDNETTTKLAYKPFWGVTKAKAIVPQKRCLTGKGPMQSVTTSQKDYVRKEIIKAKPIIPSGSIRRASGLFEGITTTSQVYKKPENVERVENFKPLLKYNRPSESFEKETTQKSSYPPICLPEKEFLPWAVKPTYKTPGIKMDTGTIYTDNFVKIELAEKEKPFYPTPAGVFLPGGEFSDQSVYKEHFHALNVERVIPIIPTGTIALPDDKMSSDTTTKSSYKPVKAEKLNPIYPKERRLLGIGKIENVTVSKLDFTPKSVAPPGLIIPSNSIKIADRPFEDSTTTAATFVHPGPMKPVENFKPVIKYQKPEIKIEDETVSKLAYPRWALQAKENLPWARKKVYEPPSNPMITNTTYQETYPEPGYYIEECIPSSRECPCAETFTCPTVNPSESVET